MLKEIVTIEFEMDNGDVVAVDGYVHYTVDKKYGADADGNRGTSMTTVDEVTGIDCESELSKEEMERAEQELVEKFLEG